MTKGAALALASILSEVFNACLKAAFPKTGLTSLGIETLTDQAFPCFMRYILPPLYLDLYLESGYYLFIFNRLSALSAKRLGSRYPLQCQ